MSVASKVFDTEAALRVRGASWTPPGLSLSALELAFPLAPGSEPIPWKSSTPTKIFAAARAALSPDELIAVNVDVQIAATTALARYPEIESIEIERPFIVVGMPRSGTTHLVNLLAADPRRRALPYWESRDPLPLPGQGPDAFGTDPRYTAAKAEHEAMMVSAPHTAALHDRFPEAIEEECELQDLDFSAYVLEWHARVPGWRDFYLGLDQTRHYGYTKKVLQALTFLRGPRTWVLKSPQHSEQLTALMATFPDATVAFTHRDPVAVIQSAATMMAYSDRLRRTSIDPDWLIDYWTDRVHRLLSAGVRDRDLVPADRSVDISFHHLNGNELAVLGDLYARAGVELTPRVTKAFQTYLDGNPRGKHGRVRYDLRKHFGVTPQDVRARFEFGLRCAYAHGTRAIRTHLDSIPPQDGISWPLSART